MSHLLQMRGLKQNQLYTHCRPHQVASFTDAWIETIGANKRQKRAMSHLLQMRGLKLAFIPGIILFCGSHLLQMRGLKQETDYSRFRLFESHLLQMRGLKLPLLLVPLLYLSRIFYRCVD